MSEKIAHGIYKLYIPLPGNPLKNLNSYLICGQERNLLIDTGFRTPACLEAMKAELDSFSIDMNKTDIFLTHMHADHIGLAPVLATDDSKMYISSVDAAFLNSLERPETQKQLIENNVSEGFPTEEFMKFVNSNSARSMVTAKPVEYACLEDGAVLNYGGYKLVCILTPGHTPGHMCLYCEELRLMFLGDHILYGITPNIVRWPNFENSLNKYLINLQKLGHYHIDIALPAHRGVDCTIAERIMSITEHHRQRLREVCDIIRENPGLTAYKIAGLMRWEIRCDSWADFPPTQKWFAVGEALAHIDYLLAAAEIHVVEKDGVRYYHTMTAPGCP